ncbi:MAG TPA: DoxX family protein [Polyangiaceae bacterium]|nr:DoxX family protein [Polyangiaceae bacterium]
MTRTEVHSQQRAELVTSTALRIMVGIILATHGALKLSDLHATAQSFAHLGIPYPDYAVYLAIAGEFLGGIGLAVGLFARVAAFGIFCSMAVAIGYVHIGHGLMAQNGGWEYPLTLGLVALFFMTRGAGAVSLDALFSGRHERARGYRAGRVRSYA